MVAPDSLSSPRAVRQATDEFLGPKRNILKPVEPGYHALCRRATDGETTAEKSEVGYSDAS